MKQPSDTFTRDMFGKNPVGRPKKPGAKTGAERMRDYRARLKFNFLAAIPSDGNSKSSPADGS